MDYSGDVYEMALEMVSVTEAFGKGVKELLSAEVREGAKHLREARKCRRQKDEKTAQKEYAACLKCYQTARTHIAKIEDESVLDWVISLCIKPIFLLVFQIVEADGNLKGLTRESALKNIDRCIQQVKREMKLKY